MLLFWMGIIFRTAKKMVKNILLFLFLSHLLTNIHTQSISGSENNEIYAHVHLALIGSTK